MIDIRPHLAAEADLYPLGFDLPEQDRDLYTLDIFDRIDQPIDIGAVSLRPLQKRAVKSAPSQSPIRRKLGIVEDMLLQFKFGPRHALIEIAADRRCISLRIDQNSSQPMRISADAVKQK